MWMNGVEYQLVEKGSIENTFIFGMVIGLLIVGSLAYLYFIGRRSVFRKYYRQLDEETRKKVECIVSRMRDDADALANQTNTSFAKGLANEFHSLIYELKRRYN